MSKRSTLNPDLTDTVIANGIQIKGDLASDSDIWIDGQIEGNIATRGSVSIGENGQIIGNIEANEVRLSGVLDGDIVASNQVVLESTASLKGSLTTANLAISSGASILGEVKVSGNFVDIEEE